MIIASRNEWECCDKAGLVSVGSYSLFVSTGGPPRKPAAPVVIFITGGGTPTEAYVLLHRAISTFARNYFVDRAGYGRSERPSFSSSSSNSSSSTGAFFDRRSATAADSSIEDDGHVTAQDSAIELRKLMHAIDVPPPYVLAAHSYGGIIARTYYGLYPDDVSGIALLDANTELLQQCLSPIPPAAFTKVIVDVDWEKFNHLREESGLSGAEWEAVMAAIERTKPASADEATHRSGRELARRRQIDQRAMGHKPLLVMQSNMPGTLRLLFEEGLRLGGGTEKDRRDAAWWMESLELFHTQVMRVQLELSSIAEFVVFDDVGHDFPIRSPVRTAELVRRLLTSVYQSSTSGTCAW